MLAKQAGGRALPALARAAAGRTAVAAQAGATSGVSGQFTADALTGNRTDLRDYAAAAVGGALGGVTTRALGARFGGAAEGAFSTAASDILHGEAPTLDEALAAAQAGSLAGRAGSAIGTSVSDKLPPVAKGHLGDGLSYVKSQLLWDRAIKRQKPLGQKPIDTVIDFESKKSREIEAKFGYGAKLSDGQLEAALRDTYYIDHFLPEHVGQIVGAATGSVASRLPDNLNLLGLDSRARRNPEDWFPIGTYRAL